MDTLQIIITIANVVVIPSFVWLAQRSIAAENKLSVLENQNTNSLKALDKLTEKIDDLLEIVYGRK